jgi:hypothetical protein
MFCFTPIRLYRYLFYPCTPISYPIPLFVLPLYPFNSWSGAAVSAWSAELAAAPLRANASSMSGTSRKRKMCGAVSELSRFISFISV